MVHTLAIRIGKRLSRTSNAALRGLTITGSLVLASATALAQAPAPSQVTPQTLRPAAAGGGGGVALPESAPLDMPEGPQDLSVTITGVRFEGGFPELAETVAALTAQVVGRPVTVAELYAFATAVEQAYAAAGYVLVRVVLPPQEIVDGGAFRLVIVDGFVEDVEVQALSPRVRDVVARRMASLVGQRHITLAEIERRVLLAGDVPGLRLRSTLVRGHRQGGTRLVLEGDHKVAQGSLGVNNTLDRSYGRWQFTSSAATNSMLGFGEQIYGSYSGSDDLESTFDGTTPLRIGGGGAVIPLGSDGLILNPEYTHSRSRPLLLDPAALATKDVFERFAVRISYPFVLTRARTLKAHGAYEHIEQTSEAIDFGVDLNHDRYSVLRAGLEHGQALASGGILVVSGTVSQGLEGRDARDAAVSGVPLSRLGSDPDFRKLLAEAHYAHPLSHDVRLGLSVRGQTSFGDALFESEQFVLDGPDTLSGFDNGTFAVDQGIAARLELSRSFVLPVGSWAKVMTPYVFGAAGRGWLMDPTAVEQESIRAASVGAGVRTSLDGPFGMPGGAINLEVARRFSDDHSDEDGYRVTFNAAIRY